jgi:hypothetical protein
MLQRTIAPLTLTMLSGTSRATAEQPLRIRGRAAGLVGWIFTKLGLSDAVSLELHPQELRLTLGSLRGVVNASIPLSQIANTRCGYVKPIWMLVVGSVFGFIAVGAMLARSGFGEVLLFLLLAAGSLAWYVLNKSLIISVETTGGAEYGVSVKRSVIEGVRLELDDALFVIERLNLAVVSAAARQRAFNRAA